MDHRQAIQILATERYFLDELTTEERERFEEHFFSCVDCAADVRAASEFIKCSKDVLSAPVSYGIAGMPESAKGRPRFRFWPALAWATLSVLLTVVVYQNAVELPRAKDELAVFRNPQIFPSIALVNSRDGGLPQVHVQRSEPFLLLVDIPENKHFPSYVAELYDPAHELEWSLPISSEAAKDAVNIRVPGVERTGEYSLVVFGKNADGSRGPETRRYAFQVLQN